MTLRVVKSLCRHQCRGSMLIIVGLVLILVLLQFFHVVLLSRLEFQEAEAAQRQEEDLIKHDLKKYDRISKILLEKISHTHILDSSGSYTIIENLSVPNSDITDFHEYGEEINVAFATHTTSNNLHHLIQLSKIWDGPISVSVFTYDDDIVSTLHFVAFLKACHPSVHKVTTFHLIFPLRHPPRNARDILNMDIDCKMRPESLITKHRDNYDFDGLEYPHNLLRNVAKKYSKTSFVLICDIDILPSPNLHGDFISFINRWQAVKSEGFTEPIVFVIPAFETKNISEILSTKSDLIRSWGFGSVRPFYWDVCWKCQKFTDYEGWKHLPEIPLLDIGYYIDWQDPWEPYYIADKNVPDYDERFKQYGFNRISQVCEVHIAGYHFAVLNNAFLIHKGFKIPGKFHSAKEEELDRNRNLFRKFKDEMREKYPSTNRQC
ncbi:hypothetical protein ScPMuIL_013890 [Solemya velum]